MDELLSFPGCDQPSPAQAGGKGASLVRLAQAGLPVPPGIILTTAFFDPWFAQLKERPAWRAFVESAGAPERCDALKAEALPLLDAQRASLAQAVAALPGPLYAVRSSSPEEDMARASFAGAYETRLGVTADGLEEAVRACFASSLDARVVAYKRQQGFDPFDPRIAVVIQQQLDSEAAGVGLSLNPLTNDYDEAVIDAAWGLGESVVSGAVSPDHFVMDKPRGQVISRARGAKQSALHLQPGGGIRRSDGHRAEDWALSDAHLTELTALLRRVEALYEGPVDVEWAVSGGALHLLQARPITRWVPLPATLQTPPGERRRLYMDLALSGGLTINAPISPIGQSFFERFAGQLIHSLLGELPVSFGPGNQLWFLEGGRMYQDLSNVLWMSTPRLLAKSLEPIDSLTAAAVGAVDAKRYRAARRPSWMSLKMLIPWLRGVWGMRSAALSFARAVFNPRAASEGRAARRRAFHEAVERLSGELSLSQLIREHGEWVLQHVMGELMPQLGVGMIADSVAQLAVPRRHQALAAQLGRGFEGNVVVEMGAALQRLSRLLTEADRADPRALVERLTRGDLPQAFMEGWADFMARYGWRGPHEVDLGSPRYADDPLLVMTQLCTMGGTDFDPLEAQAAQVRARREATAALMERLGPLRRWALRWASIRMDLFLGTRDDPKHDYLRFFHRARQRALAEGRALAAAGRLDRAEDVMGLTVEDLEAAAGDPSLDLRSIRRENTRFLDRLRELVTAFPPVIDSRGRILRPPQGPRIPGQLVGAPVSPGVARGPVKVLHHPSEKPILPGDILVAHTTDPGWTPLFANAGAIVLEVGGMLQHGALVAREYGKPCVVGIEDVLDRLSDGQQVEVDGAAGTVRILEGS